VRPRTRRAHAAQRTAPPLVLQYSLSVALTGYVKALEDALAVIDTIAFPIDTTDGALPPLTP
jgi:hypothetical protein